MMRAIKSIGAFALVLSAAAIARADTDKGTIRSVNNDRREVVVKGLVKDTTYELDKDATVWLDGARAKLSDLKAEDRVAIIYEKKGNHYMAAQVRGLRSAQETTGTVADVFGDKKEVTLKGTIKNTTYEMDKQATVFVNSKKAALADIRAGDEVLITYIERGKHLMAQDVTLLKRGK